MKQLIDALKSARKIEILIVAALLCALLVLWMGAEGGGTGASDAEARMERILSEIEGAGNVSVMIAHAADGTAEGAVVAASGADDVGVMLEIQRAVRTLTGLDLERIEIVKSKR